jgi:hypothetical protein
MFTYTSVKVVMRCITVCLLNCSSSSSNSTCALRHSLSCCVKSWFRFVAAIPAYVELHFHLIVVLFSELDHGCISVAKNICAVKQCCC